MAMATAQYNLGRMYLKGEGVAADNGTAFQWFRRAAKQDNVPAEFELSHLYATGRGIPKRTRRRR